MAVQRLGRDMGIRARAVGAERHAVGARVVDELLEVGRRHILVDDHRQVAGVEPGDQREVPVRIVGQLLEQHLVHDHRRRDGLHQRIAVGRCGLDLLGRDRARRPRLVLDEHRLAGLLGDVFAVDAGEDVGEAARRIAADDADGFAGPSLCEGRSSQSARRRGGRARTHDDAPRDTVDHRCLPAAPLFDCWVTIQAVLAAPPRSMAAIGPGVKPPRPARPVLPRPKATRRVWP